MNPQFMKMVQTKSLKSAKSKLNINKTQLTPHKINMEQALDTIPIPKQPISKLDYFEMLAEKAYLIRLKKMQETSTLNKRTIDIDMNRSFNEYKINNVPPIITNNKSRDVSREKKKDIEEESNRS